VLLSCKATLTIVCLAWSNDKLVVRRSFVSITNALLDWSNIQLFLIHRGRWRAEGKKKYAPSLDWLAWMLYRARFRPTWTICRRSALGAGVGHERTPNRPYRSVLNVNLDQNSPKTMEKNCRVSCRSPWGRLMRYKKPVAGLRPHDLVPIDLMAGGL
jgi:hypothetical protein